MDCEAKKVLKTWFPAFVESARNRGDELTGVLSDCAREEFVNSLVAEHMRSSTRQADPMFWARCEWEKVDICFGRAKAPFSQSAWNDAWAEGPDGANELGFIEAKVIYGHRPDAREKISKMKAQIETTRLRVSSYDRTPAPAFGLVYWVSFEGNAPDSLLGPLEEAGFRPVLDEPFAEIHRTSLKDKWPLTDATDDMVLHIGLFSLESP